MELFLKAKTDIEDLIIDYIEAQLKTGKTVSLNWEGSSVERSSSGGITAHYFGVCFDEESADGKLDMLADMKVVSVGTYSEEHGGEGEHPLIIESMDFLECRSLEFTDIYSSIAEKGARKRNLRVKCEIASITIFLQVHGGEYGCFNIRS